MHASCICAPSCTLRLPSPERKSENPAPVARSPRKAMPGLSSTNVLMAASVTCKNQICIKHTIKHILVLPTQTHAGTHTNLNTSTSTHLPTHLLPPWHVQGDEGGQDSRLSKQLSSHVGCELFIVTDVQVLHRTQITLNTTVIALLPLYKKGLLVEIHSPMLTCSASSWPMTPSTWAVLISSLFSWCSVSERSLSRSPSSGFRLVTEVLDRSRLSSRGRVHTSGSPAS